MGVYLHDNTSWVMTSMLPRRAVLLGLAAMTAGWPVRGRGQAGSHLIGIWWSPEQVRSQESGGPRFSNIRTAAHGPKAVIRRSKSRTAAASGHVVMCYRFLGKLTA
jgi:hypothetical protein